MASPLLSKKVCVVGAGMAGLAAARELRREGHNVTVLDVGGQWLYDPMTDGDDPLGAAAPVKVHSRMYASLRLMSPRESMGFSDFPFLPKEGRFPGHREVYCYLRDFCDTFGLMDSVRLNTRVVRVAKAPGAAGGGGSGLRWRVTAERADPESGKEAPSRTEEVFDAVVVANGHYSQPRLPRIGGMERWQLHSHSYRSPEPFRGEAVAVVGCGQSGAGAERRRQGGAPQRQFQMTKRTRPRRRRPARTISAAGPHHERLQQDSESVCEALQQWRLSAAHHSDDEENKTTTATICQNNFSCRSAP